MINRDLINKVNQAYTIRFRREIEGESLSPLWSDLVTTFQSTKRVENYYWFTQFYNLRRWIGEREAYTGFVEEYLIRNDKYESTVVTSIEDIEDGVALAGKAAQIAGMVRAYNRKRDQLMVELLFQNGFTAPAASNGLNTIDNKAYFATDHPWYDVSVLKANGKETVNIDPSGTWSNKGTAALSADALWAAMVAFMQQVDFYGQPVGVRPNLLVVGPSNMRLGNQLINDPVSIETVGAGDSVVIPNDVRRLGLRLHVDPRITDGKWYLFDTTAPEDAKPIIFQQRVAPQLQMTGTFSADASAGMVSDTIFDHDEIRHGLRTRFGMGYGLPYYSYGSDASA